MKKAILSLLLASALLLVSGCSVLDDVASFFRPEEMVFSVDAYHLQITADSDFRENTGGAFDLQITNDASYVSIMAYTYADLPDDVTPLDVLDLQNEDLFSRRDDVTVLEEAKTQTLSQYVLTQALYSAKNDGAKNYYVTYLIDFPAAETLAWVLVSATPSYFEDNRDYLHGIVCSLETV